MKTTLYNLALMTLLFGLVGTGCYTQVGSTRDDRFSGDYQDTSVVPEESVQADDSSNASTDPYFDPNGNPRDRWYLTYAAPVWVGVGVGFGWSDPWYYNPWYYDNFWCWNSPAYYYPPAWYPYGGYYPPYWCYGGGYSNGGSYATTRNFGNTRGSGHSRGTYGSSRGGYEPAGRTTPVSMDLPGAMRQGTGARTPAAKATAPGKRVEQAPGRRQETARGNSGSGNRVREATRPAPRRPARTEQSPPTSPSYTPQSGSPSGGSRSGVSSPPSSAPRPSGDSGGSRGSGSTRGGGGGGRR